MNDFVRHAASVPVEGRSEYGHSFGGVLDQPAIPPGGKYPCHLLFTIDTHDPAFPLRGRDRFLPLLYCQQYNAAALCYHLEDGNVVVDWIESLDWDSDFPYEAYPSVFERRDIALAPVSMTQLGIEEAENREQALPVSRFGGWHWLCQGIPDIECRNPNCDPGSMDVLGVVYNEPVKGIRLWDPDDEWCDVEIIYQMCRSCASIHVCNRCN